MPQIHTIRDSVNNIVFNIAQISETPKAKKTIASNLVSLWIGKEIPEDKIEIIEEWNRKNPEIPFTLWYHSDYAENMPQWQAAAKKYNFSLCDLKSLEKVMDPHDVALARYYIAGPHANYAAASDIYRLAAIRHMLTLVMQQPTDILAGHEVGFIYRDMDVRCGNKKLPANLDGIFLFNHFNLNNDETVNLMYKNAKQPVKGRIGNDIFAVGSEGLQLLTNLQDYIYKASYIALREGRHYLADPKEERGNAYVTQTLVQTGPIAWKELLRKVGILYSIPVPPELEANIKKLPPHEQRLAINEYCLNQLRKGWYFEPGTYFQTANSDGSWLEIKDGKAYLKYKKYDNREALLEDLLIRLNFELKELPKDKVFINTYLEDVIEHYPHLFMNQDDVVYFINNLYNRLGKDHPERKTELASSKKESRTQFKNVKPEVAQIDPPVMSKFESVKNSTFTNQKQIASDQSGKINQQIASDQSVKVDSTEKTTNKTSNDSVFAVTESVPFSALMELGLFTLNKLGICRVAKKLDDIEGYDVRKQSAQLSLRQAGSSLEAAISESFGKIYERAEQSEQIRMENFIIDFVNGEVSSHIKKLFKDAMVYKKEFKRGQEMLGVMKEYEKENEPNAAYSVYPNQ